MNTSNTFKAVAMALLLIAGSPVIAEDQGNQAQEMIYGRQLMTEQERIEFRAKMRAAKSQQERDQIRWEHHQQMQERAKEQGVELPDEPPARGMGQGQGKGAGQGMRPH